MIGEPPQLSAELQQQHLEIPSLYMAAMGSWVPEVEAASPLKPPVTQNSQRGAPRHLPLHGEQTDALQAMTGDWRAELLWSITILDRFPRAGNPSSTGSTPIQHALLLYFCRRLLPGAFHQVHLGLGLPGHGRLLLQLLQLLQLRCLSQVSLEKHRGGTRGVGDDVVPRDAIGAADDLGVGYTFFWLLLAGAECRGAQHVSKDLTQSVQGPCFLSLLLKRAVKGTMLTDGGGAAEVPGSVMPLLLCTFMIVSMQLGFAMLEVGCVRQEHRMTVLAKNLLDTMVSSLSFSLGCEIFQPSIVKQDGVSENHLIFLHWAFLSTSVTICSGSMAERAHLAAYLCYAVLMSGLAYPILADSVWGDGTGAGFLYHQFHPSGGHRYYDYAGGGVIHLAGAMAALAGNLLLGRRILRPPPKELSHTQGDETTQLKEAIQETWQRRFDRAEDDEKEFRPNSYLQVMGVLNLWVGCYGFNASPAFARGDPHRVEIAALSAWNTTLAAGAGACGTFLHSCIFHKNMQLGFLCNGLLSGLVCLTVACDILTPATTILLGFLCGFLVYPAGSYALKKMRIDDPADAIPVHAGSAIFGILSVAFCTPSCDTESGSAYGHHFCDDDHTIGGQLLVQLLGVGTILVWTFCVIFPVWAVFLVSECVYSLELEQLSATYEHACHVDLEAAKSLEEDFWTGAARNSRITRHLLRQHGWNWIGSPFKDAAAASDFRQDMVEAIHSSKTALEMDVVAVWLLHGIARQFARFRCFREMARLRLRIAPFAELSGLGAMAGTGKEVAEIVREVLEIVTDSHGEAW
eukprot:s3092_g1.t1